MNVKEKAHNKRQLDLITKKIDQYYNGDTYGLDLISDLSALIACIDNIPDAIREELTMKLNKIDLVYAIILFEKRTHVSNEEQRKINTNLAAFESILKEYAIANNLENFDEEYETYKQEYSDATALNKK